MEEDGPPRREIEYLLALQLRLQAAEACALVCEALPLARVWLQDPERGAVAASYEKGVRSYAWIVRVSEFGRIGGGGAYLLSEISMALSLGQGVEVGTDWY